MNKEIENSKGKDFKDMTEKEQMEYLYQKWKNNKEEDAYLKYMRELCCEGRR